MQIGREMAKESKTKSGQATDKKYVSKWIFHEQVKFLRPVMATTKSRDSISTQNNDWMIQFHFQRINLLRKKKKKKKETKSLKKTFTYKKLLIFL